MLNNRINKLGVLVIGGLLSFVVFAADGDRKQGPASQYTVTVKKVELCTSSACTTAHILVTKTSPMDIAGATVGATVGSYASTMTMPPMGVTYSHMRTTIDRTFAIKGYARSNGSGDYCYTTTGSDGTTTRYAAGGIKLAGTEGSDAAAAAAALAAATVANLELPDTGNGAITANDNVADLVGDNTIGTITYSSTITVPDPADSSSALFVVALTTPYTYYGQTPIIDIAFTTQTGVITVENDGGNLATECNLHPGEPTMTVTIK
jgi:hypothetical protein